MQTPNAALVGQAALWMAHFGTTNSRLGMGQVGDIFSAAPIYEWNAAENALRMVGILSSADPSALLMDLEDIPQHLERTFDAEDPKLNRLLHAFFAVACWHSLPTTRQPFSVPDGFERISGLMVEAGYLVETGRCLVAWTDKAGPGMQDASLWNGDFESYSDLRRSSELAEIASIIESCPPEIVARFAGTDDLDGWRSVIAGGQ